VAEQVLHLPVRIGYPQGVGGLTEGMNNPMYATGVGLVLFGSRVKTNGFNGSGGSEHSLIKLGQRMKKWFEEVI
jgi:cell division protein FtsA